MKLLNAIRRAFLSFVISSIDRQISDMQKAMRRPMSVEEYAVRLADFEATKADLARARSDYNALLPVGQRRTWKTA